MLNDCMYNIEFHMLPKHMKGIPMSTGILICESAPICLIEKQNLVAFSQKVQKNLKIACTLKTKREILEQGVVCAESLIPYIISVCLHKPVYIKLSHKADALSQQIATWASSKKNKRQNKQKSNEQ